MSVKLVHKIEAFGTRIRFLVQNEETKNAVQFMFDLGYFKQTSLCSVTVEIIAIELGYHSVKPKYEGQKPMSGPCEVLGNNLSCYYDGSSLQALELLESYVKDGGADVVWSRLEEVYMHNFNEEF